MISLRHETLPAGLCALVRRRADGDLEVIVSSALSAGRRRAAVRAGLRAIQPARRSAGWLTAPALITLALAGNWLRVVGRLIRLHQAASVAVAATATAAAVFIAVAPPLLHSPGGGRNPAGGALAPQPGPAAGLAAPARSRATPSSAAVVQPPTSAVPVAAGSSIGPTATPTPTPTPAPSASASGGSGGICLELLGIWVCL